MKKSMFEMSNTVLGIEKSEPIPPEFGAHTGNITAFVGCNPKPHVLTMIHNFLAENPKGIVLLNDTCGRFNTTDLMYGVEQSIHDRIELYQHGDQSPMNLLSFVGGVVDAARSEDAKVVIVSSTASTVERDHSFQSWSHAYRTIAKMIRGTNVSFVSCGELVRTPQDPHPELPCPPFPSDTVIKLTKKELQHGKTISDVKDDENNAKARPK